MHGRTFSIAGALVLLAAVPAGAEPPPALVEEAEEAFAVCGELGGEARILHGYRTEADLNGDGIADYVTDLARMECAGAWSAFCGSSGCPVAVWLSEPGARYTRFDLGPLQGFEVLLGSGGELPVLRAGYHGSLCGEDAGATETCTRSWRFESNAPERPARDPAAPPPAEPEVQAGPAEPAPDAVSPSVPEDAAPVEPVEPGWTLRRVPGSSPVALGGGTGRVASLAAFCLQGAPFLAVSFTEPPAGDTAVLVFEFSQGDVAEEAAFEETAGGAYVVALDQGILAPRLAGRDREVGLRAGGVDEGTLSLAGSTRTIRAALADCHDF